MPLYYYNPQSTMLYVALVLPALLLSLWAQVRVKSAYSKMSRMYVSSGYTGAQAAAAVLRHYGITNVRIEVTGGRLSDHYDPRGNVIRLSEPVFNSKTVAAVGIACHEAGHAAQHAQNYAPIKVRNSIIKVSTIGSYAGIPLALLGYFMGFGWLIYAGLGLYSMIAVFQLVTLPVEFNASRRAMQVIEETGLLRTDEEVRGARKVLTAAALTYVAALAVTLANLLRFVVLFLGRGSSRRD